MISVSDENAVTRSALQRYPSRFFASYSADPNRGMTEVRNIVRMQREYGIKAVTAFPCGLCPQVPIDDKKWYPVYAKCVELDVPLVVQVGHSAESMPSAAGRPLLLDDVALYFPELRIVAAHTGWPWVEELIALAWKHRNVYIGTSAHAPKYWDPALVRFLRSRGQGKVLFGTDYPVLRHAEALAQLPMNPM